MKLSNIYIYNIGKFDPPTVEAGTTETINPGLDASVINSGTEDNLVLDFRIPRGINGLSSNSVDYSNSKTLTMNDVSDSVKKIFSMTSPSSGLLVLKINMTNPQTFDSWQTISVNGKNIFSGLFANGNNIHSFAVTANDEIRWNFYLGGQFNTIDAVLYAYSENTYSEEESNVGMWVDGRTIYRKMWLNVPYRTDGSFNSPISVSDLNIDTVLKIDGIRNQSIGRYPNGYNCVVYFDGDNNTINGALQNGSSSVGTGTYKYISVDYIKKQ